MQCSIGNIVNINPCFQIWSFWCSDETMKTWTSGVLLLHQIRIESDKWTFSLRECALTSRGLKSCSSLWQTSLLRHNRSIPCEILQHYKLSSTRSLVIVDYCFIFWLFLDVYNSRRKKNSYSVLLEPLLSSQGYVKFWNNYWQYGEHITVSWVWCNIKYNELHLLDLRRVISLILKCSFYVAR